MKKIVTLGLGLCVAVAFTSCKSQESAYKKAYEKAKQQQAAEQQQPTTTTQVAVAPVQTTTTTPVQTTTTPTTVTDANVRTESVQLYAPASALPQDKKERQRISTSKTEIPRRMFFTCLYFSSFTPPASSCRYGMSASAVMA